LIFPRGSFSPPTFSRQQNRGLSAVLFFFLIPSAHILFIPLSSCPLETPHSSCVGINPFVFQLSHSFFVPSLSCTFVRVCEPSFFPLYSQTSSASEEVGGCLVFAFVMVDPGSLPPPPPPPFDTCRANGSDCNLSCPSPLLVKPPEILVSFFPSGLLSPL